MIKNHCVWTKCLLVPPLIAIAGFAAAKEPPITCVRFAPGGEKLLSVSQSGLRILAWHDLSEKRRIELDFANPHCIAFSPQGNFVALGGGNPAEFGCVTVYRWPRMEKIAEYDDFDDSVTSIAWESEASFFAASLDRSVKRIGTITEGTSSGESQLDEIATYLGHSRAVRGLCLLKKKNVLITAGYDQSVRVWNVASGELIRSLSQHTQPIHSVSPQPAEQGLPYIASAAQDRTIRFWQPTIGRMVRYARLESEPLNIVWSPTGEQLFAVCTDGCLHVVDPVDVNVKHRIAAIDGWAYAVDVHPLEPAVAVAGSHGQLQKVSLSEE
ncbi:MAG: WD40 repeat domain-containing protein [Aureliella sp.]